MTVALMSAAAMGAESNAFVTQSLAERSKPAGATMFTEMSAQQTGIVTENRYADPKMWAERNREFDIGGIGTGVAIADYDGDGRPDVFVVSKTESCRLFRNLGGWKFEDVTEKAGVADRGPDAAVWKQGATFADVNNDGWLDLYVCRFGAPNRLYINRGDGTFAEEAERRGLGLSDASGVGAFADYDRDGWLDVYVQTNLLESETAPKGQRDRLYRNKGHGVFEDVTERAGLRSEGTQGHAIVWWDFNEDGWPDLYVANDFAVADYLYRNNGDGTFTETIDAAVPHFPFSSMGADLGDVNNDGRVDFLATEMAASTPQKDHRGMAEARARGQMEDPMPGRAQHYMRNALYVNTGTGVFQEAAYLAGIATTDWTWSVRFEDLDNDGRLDLHVTNGMYREMNNADLLHRQMTTESLPGRVQLVKASPVFREKNFAFKNRGELEFEDVSAAWGLDQRSVSFGAAFGDLDGDGDLDLVYANYEAGVTVLRNDAIAGNRAVFVLRGTRSNRFGIGAVVRIETEAGVQVRPLTVARGYLSSSEPAAHFGLGEAERIRKVEIRWPSGAVQTLADLPVNRRFVVTEPAEEEPARDEGVRGRRPLFEDVSEAAGFALKSREGDVDERSAQPLLPMRHNRRGPALALIDFDGDGAEDVAIGGTPRDPLRLLHRSGRGKFSLIGAIGEAGEAPLNDGPILAFDANGDGRTDLLQTRGGAALPAGLPPYQPRLLINNGAGLEIAAPEVLPVFRSSVGAAVAADFDRDGRLDVFLGGRVSPGEYPLPAKSALWANRGGRFEDVTEHVAPELREVGLVTAALWTDVDGDGWIDLLLALEWDTVRFFRNVSGRGFEDGTEGAGFAAAGRGWWSALAAADFNGDGRIDYVAGNVGLNTQYRASVERPALLFYGEFAEEGAPQIVEAGWEGDRLFPWRARKQLGAQIPSVLRKFPRSDVYARAPLQEIVGDEKLRAARRFAATELRSGVFLSQPDGTYRFSALPRIAQVAPLQGMVAGDFDGDGFADVYAVQNSFGPIPLVGRFDGGISQWLKGDGRGGFVAVPASESGLVVRGDAKALVATDIDDDGWPDFLVSRNNDTTLAFRNAGTAGARPLRVSVRGGGVGARVTAEMADGTRQMSEVYAGSGYYSQSSAEVFLGSRESNPVKRLRVRWADGSETVQEVDDGATRVETRRR